MLVLTGIGLVISIAVGPNLVGAFSDLGFFGGFVVTLFFLLCAVMTVIGGFGVVVLLGDMVLGRVHSVSGLPTLRREGIRTNALARPLPRAPPCRACRLQRR